MTAIVLKQDPNKIKNKLKKTLDTKMTQFNQKQISGLALHLIHHKFLPFNCCVSVVL